MSSMTTPPEPEPKKYPILNKNPYFWLVILSIILFSVLASIVSVALFGGDDKEDSSPQPSVTVTATPEAKDFTPNFDAVPNGDIETKEGFSEYIREVFPVLEDATDNEIAEVAETTCDVLDEGKSFPEAIAQAGKTAKNLDEAGAYGGISGLAVDVLCPEYQSLMEEYSN